MTSHKRDDEQSNEDVDEWCDVSSDSDIFHAEAFDNKSWTTEQDRDLERIEHIRDQLQCCLLLPPDPQDASRD